MECEDRRALVSRKTGEGSIIDAVEETKAKEFRDEYEEKHNMGRPLRQDRQSEERKIGNGRLRQCASAQNPQELCCEVVEGRGNESDFKQDESKETEISR